MRDHFPYLTETPKKKEDKDKMNVVPQLESEQGDVRSLTHTREE